MHILITGATGWIGRHVLSLLTASPSKHTISALSRSPESDKALLALHPKITLIRGDLTTRETLTQAAKTADAIIHLAFIHDFASPTHDFAKNITIDNEAVKALAAGLRPGCVFINSSGLVGGAKDGQAYKESDAGSGFRPDLYDHLAQAGLIPVVIRLSPTVHGTGDKGFASALVATAKKTGISAYVGEGKARWPAVHVKDAARLYVLALETGKAGVYHAAENEGWCIKDIAETIGQRMGVPVKSVTPEEAGNQWFGLMGTLLQMDSPVSTGITREVTGWEPKELNLLEDLKTSETYFAEGAANVLL